MKRIKSKISIKNFILARQFRGYTQTSLCQNIKYLSQSNLSKFEKGYFGVISEDKIKEIMKFLDFPFEFLLKDEIKTNINTWNL